MGYAELLDLALQLGKAARDPKHQGMFALVTGDGKLVLTESKKFHRLNGLLSAEVLLVTRDQLPHLAQMRQAWNRRVKTHDRWVSVQEYAMALDLASIDLFRRAVELHND